MEADIKENKIEVILVDEEDNQIGTMEKLEAHRKALLHRAISVFIMNSKGEWLLQKRAYNKYHSSGLWSNTCCSHPFPDESIEDAANRRLLEEMGMKCELSKIFHFIYKTELENELTEHELDHVFLGVCDELPAINDEEVVDWKYIGLDELKKDIEENPEHYSFWFRQLQKKVSQYLINRQAS